MPRRTRPNPIWLAFAAALLLFAGAARAADQGFETKAQHAILIDAATGTILFRKAADAPMPPASLAKLMTAAVIFDALKSGRLHLDDMFSISENAWRKGGAASGGSTMFAALNSSISLDNLLHAIIIQSANDGCIAVAEGMAGSEAAFADMMNAEAKKLGLTGSHFTNATGLPDPDQHVTAHDLARLAAYIIKEYPQYYAIYSQTEFTWNKIRQYNRNPLLGMNLGADGMKTGYTDEAGYGLVGSAIQNGERLIMVVSGTETDKQRAEESQKLMQWGFTAFQRVNFFKDREVIGEASVFGGDRGSVGLVGSGPIDLVLPSEASDERLTGRILYKGPVPAPIAAGQEIGTLQISRGDEILREAPVYAAEDVGIGGFTRRAFDGLKELVFGWW